MSQKKSVGGMAHRDERSQPVPSRELALGGHGCGSPRALTAWQGCTFFTPWPQFPHQTVTGGGSQESSHREAEACPFPQPKVWVRSAVPGTLGTKWIQRSGTSHEKMGKCLLLRPQRGTSNMPKADQTETSTVKSPGDAVEKRHSAPMELSSISQENDCIRQFMTRG